MVDTCFKQYKIEKNIASDCKQIGIVMQFEDQFNLPIHKFIKTVGIP